MGNLNKVTYTDHQTVITADNLNAIQDSVIQNTSYTTCDTSAGTAAKTAALTNFVLTTGSAVKVKFTNTNTADNPTLNINSTGAKEIYINATTAAGTYARTSWAAGSVVTLVYDGSHWIIVRTGDASVMAMTPIFLTENTDLDTLTTAGTYRVWGAYTNSPTTNNIYGVLTVSGIPGALIQIYQAATSSNSFFRGYTNSQWYPWRQFMLNSGGIFGGTVSIDRADGTTSATGTSTLWVGNNTPTGTNGNSKGQVVLYGNGANYVNIQASNATGNRTVELPNANGTIALEKARDDITSSAFTLSATGVTVNMNVCIKIGDMFSARLGFIKTDSSNFAQGRIFMGTLSNRAKPVIARYYIGAASNGVNSFINRYVGVAIATDGTINIDNVFSSDVKQIYVCVDYMCADRT